MSDGRANTARMFSPPVRTLGTLFHHFPVGFHVVQYPIHRPIRKYSRGVICRGRRCPIGRHRFSRRRAPHARVVVVIARRPYDDDTAPPWCRRSAGQSYYRVWSDISHTAARPSSVYRVVVIYLHHIAALTFATIHRVYFRTHTSQL